jgi:hypothetical protein
VDRAGTSRRDARSLLTLAHQLHTSRDAVRAHLVRATRRLRRLATSGGCAASSAAAISVGGTAALTGGVARLADVTGGGTSVFIRSRLLTAGHDVGAVIGDHGNSGLARLLHPATGGTSDGLLAVLAFLVACLALVGIKLLVSRRQRTTGATGDAL